MRMLSKFPLQALAVFVCYFHSLHAEIRNEKIQHVDDEPKTFVVRYKSGDQTIPVTVVLDYKKQTEYVINMNQRTPAKSVTLYDFKQRTIAYKDLTNRECFLGRLTHQTLSEEMDALSRVQNPVDHQPKILTLNPHRSALTPTEIRNIAGQKTAVFCRKMNTWLIMPEESHNIQKRDIDDDEFEERTYHRHGYHTVQYSHYGRETRRRFRNSRRNGSRPWSYENKNTSDSSNPNFGIFEASSSLKENISPQGTSATYIKAEDQPVLPENTSSASKPHNLLSRENMHSPSSTHRTVLPLSVLHAKDNSTPDNENTPSISAKLIHAKHHSGYENQSPFSSDLYNSGEQNTDGINHGQNIPNTHSTLHTGNDLESNLHPEISEPSNHNTKFQTFNVHSPGINHDDQLTENHNYLETRNKRREIESEDFPNNFSKPIPPKTYFANENSYDVPEDPDVSTNVLEIPKITKKFENVHHNSHLDGLLPQTKEDVHDVFEGFYNLGQNHPLTDENFENPNLYPLENYKEGIVFNSEANLINSFPVSAHNEVNDSTPKSILWREHTFFQTPLDTTSTTDSPITISAYTVSNQMTSIPRQLSQSLPSNSLNIHRKSDSYFGETPFIRGTIGDPERRQDYASENNNIIPQYQVENGLSETQTSYFSTESILNGHIHYIDKSHRSDTPSENDNSENQLVSQDNFLLQSENKSNHSRHSPLVPTEIIHEGIYPPQVRFHTALRNYKPDEIIIDVEKIPTPRPSESTSGFRDRTFDISDKINRKATPTLTSGNGEKRSEQISGVTWRSNHSPIARNPSRKVNINSPKQFRVTETLPSRKVDASHPHHHNGINENLDHSANNVHQRNPSRKHNVLSQSHHGRSFHRPFYKLDNLPPGVSIHPRHPQAPYADMFNSNMPPSLPQESNLRTMKHHRQRHHRKKNRLNSCCRTAGKVNGNLLSCCRASGSCCSGHHGRSAASRTSCCSPTKSNKNGQASPSSRNHVVSTNRISVQHSRRTSENYQNEQVVSTPRHQVLTANQIPSQQGRRSYGELRDGSTFSSRPNRIILPSEDQPQSRRATEDNRERCLKEKMCRTVYESTQQVIVCRNANIEGCS